MYPTSANASAASSLLSELVSDSSGEMLRTLRRKLEEAAENFSVELKSYPPAKQEALAPLQSVFESARDILDKAALAVEKARSAP